MMCYDKDEIRRYIEYAKGRGVDFDLTNPEKQLYADIAMAMIAYNQLYEEKERRKENLEKIMHAQSLADKEILEVKKKNENKDTE